MAHAKYSPSAAHRWMMCPASVLLSLKAPQPKESIYAKEGTDAHSCLEEFLKGKRSNITKTKKKLLKDFPLDMVEYAMDAAMEIWALAEDGGELVFETKFHMDHISKDFSGTVDAAIVDVYGTLKIIDFKYGAGFLVSPEENAQMIAYAVGVAYKYDYDFKDVELVIIQPRANTEDGETTRKWKTDIDTIKAWEMRFKDGILACEKGKDFSAGEWCKFCPAKIICPEISDTAMKTAQIDFAPQTMVKKGVVKEPKLLEISSIQNDLLPEILIALPKIEDWIDAVKTHAFDSLLQGAKISGFKLVEKRGTRKWSNAEVASELARESFGVTAFTEPTLKSPAQLEKSFGNKAKGFAAEHAVSVSSGLTMVSESDKRPAAVTDGSKDFTVIE